MDKILPFRTLENGNNMFLRRILDYEKSILFIISKNNSFIRSMSPFRYKYPNKVSKPVAARYSLGWELFGTWLPVAFLPRLKISISSSVQYSFKNSTALHWEEAHTILTALWCSLFTGILPEDVIYSRTSSSNTASPKKARVNGLYCFGWVSGFINGNVKPLPFSINIRNQIAIQTGQQYPLLGCPFLLTAR